LFQSGDAEAAQTAARQRGYQALAAHTLIMKQLMKAIENYDFDAAIEYVISLDNTLS